MRALVGRAQRRLAVDGLELSAHRGDGVGGGGFLGRRLDVLEVRALRLQRRGLDAETRRTAGRRARLGGRRWWRGRCFGRGGGGLLDAHLLREGLADAAKAGHGRAGCLDGLLRLEELLLVELELADEVVDLVGAAVVRHKVAERMQAVHDFRKVFLLVQVRELEAEAARQADLVDELEVVVDVVRVPELQLGVHKDARDARRLERLGHLGERNAVPHLLGHVRDVAAQRLANAALHPLLGLAAVAQVLVGLDVVPLPVQPLAARRLAAVLQRGHRRRCLHIDARKRLETLPRETDPCVAQRAGGLTHLARRLAAAHDRRLGTRNRPVLTPTRCLDRLSARGLLHEWIRRQLAALEARGRPAGRRISCYGPQGRSLKLAAHISRPRLRRRMLPKRLTQRRRAHRQWGLKGLVRTPCHKHTTRRVLFCT